MKTRQVFYALLLLVSVAQALPAEIQRIDLRVEGMT
jgi:hypothetical protein